MGLWDGFACGDRFAKHVHGRRDPQTDGAQGSSVGGTALIAKELLHVVAEIAAQVRGQRAKQEPIGAVSDGHHDFLGAWGFSSRWVRALLTIDCSRRASRRATSRPSDVSAK